MSLSSHRSQAKIKLAIFDKEGYLTNEVIQICKDIGIDEQDLYQRDIEDFKEVGQEDGQITKIQQMRFQHYEKRRQIKINAIKETMKLIREMELEKQKAVEQAIKQTTQMTVLDIKQNKNKEIKLQQIIYQMEKEQLLGLQDQSENKKQNIHSFQAIDDGYNPKEISQKQQNMYINKSFHLQSGYGNQNKGKDSNSLNKRSYNQVKNGYQEDQFNQKYVNNSNNQSILSDAQNITLGSKSVVLQRAGSRKHHFTQGDHEEDCKSKYNTLEQQNSRQKLRNYTASISPYNKDQSLLNKTLPHQSVNTVVENLDYEVKLKLVRKLMRMERNDEIKKEVAKQKEEAENQIKEELEQKEQAFAQNHAKILKQKEEILKKKMKDQKAHQMIVRSQVKARQKEQEKERIKIKEQQIKEIELRMQLEQKKLEEEEKQSFLRYLERNEEKRQIEEFKKLKQEQQIQKALQFMQEIEKEQQAKQQKHNQILSQKQREVSKKIEQRQNRAKSNIIMREQEIQANKSHTIQKIIQSIQSNSVTNQERKRNTSVYQASKMVEIKSKKEEFEREQSIKLLDKVKQYDIKVKQAEQFKNQVFNENSAQKKEQFQLKREGVLENLAIKDYQWELQRQKEMDKYKQKIEMAKINKNIKEEINFLTQQGVKDMYNILKKQKEQ
ncbi:hypothetical protein TTHERM_00467880 (macronuclear) [Tetrahymena thermophila SB210]|uniref:Uncharacterized protein n=1 Tax=Tetrahymena thermophila (strain SB210) TaxID=312017 RepID=I7MIY4_TETTS|nr:hypothetical protein TTHERM_00467880 [Tetrahymena thermophila SB210]EAS04838.1 hypothetical protein TTHERM_00467880 [Tetrahymena thermophila SB210]|eukprot:XP_001025083.1 hypothetical protein TTHERM_00467880 [Tetrahymena thermophila SB210]